MEAGLIRHTMRHMGLCLLQICGQNKEAVFSEGAYAEWLGVAREPGHIIDVLLSCSCVKHESINYGIEIKYREKTDGEVDVEV